MRYRWVAGLIVVAAVAISAAPRGPIFSREESAYQNTPQLTDENRLTEQRIEELVKTDPVAALGAALAKYRTDVHRFTATLHKRERIGKTLHPEEVVRMTVKEKPFSVMMIWESGSRNQAEGTLYVTGENGGNMKVWRPNALLAKTLNLAPNDSIARSASRYGLAESSIYHGQYRTYDRWKSVQKMGQLKVDYRGKKAIPELGGRICHELVRTCEPAEADAFILGESPRSDPNQLFTTVQIFLDAETGYQVGAVLTRADGQLIGSYFFRDVLLNPSFPPGQFTPAAFGK